MSGAGRSPSPRAGIPPGPGGVGGAPGVSPQIRSHHRPPRTAACAAGRPGLPPNPSPPLDCFYFPCAPVSRGGPSPALVVSGANETWGLAGETRRGSGPSLRAGGVARWGPEEAVPAEAKGCQSTHGLRAEPERQDRQWWALGPGWGLVSCRGRPCSGHWEPRRFAGRTLRPGRASPRGWAVTPPGQPEGPRRRDRAVTGTSTL